MNVSATGNGRSGQGETPPFPFEKLEAFQLALEIADLADEIAARQRRERRWAADQLGSASLSILNNTAEGLGEYSPGDKVRFLRYALRSAAETAAMIIFLARKRVISPRIERQARALLLKYTKTATRMILYFQRQRRAKRGS